MAVTTEPRKIQKNHPVWAVYDLLRTTRLNVRYYTAKTERTKQKDRWIEIILAIVVPSSALAGLPLWQSQYGIYVWSTLTVIASLLAIVKPFLKLTESVQAYEAVVSRLRAIEGDLVELQNEIFQQRRYDQRMQERLSLIVRSMGRVQEIEPIEPIDEELRRTIFDQIRRESPNESFYVPEV
ncbi:MAG TPA: hypothetical protein VFZ66_13275 [Herpetosiphonaceae bacterium]